jgi:hypothetical protein
MMAFIAVSLCGPGAQERLSVVSADDIILAIISIWAAQPTITRAAQLKSKKKSVFKLGYGGSNTTVLLTNRTLTHPSNLSLPFLRTA